MFECMEEHIDEDDSDPDERYELVEFKKGMTKLKFILKILY